MIVLAVVECSLNLLLDLLRGGIRELEPSSAGGTAVSLPVCLVITAR